MQRGQHRRNKFFLNYEIKMNNNNSLYQNLHDATKVTLRENVQFWMLE